MNTNNAHDDERTAMPAKELLDQVIYETEEALKAMKDRNFSPAIRLNAAINLREDLVDMLKGVS
jgi:hypothetical protein